MYNPNLIRVLGYRRKRKVTYIKPILAVITAAILLVLSSPFI